MAKIKVKKMKRQSKTMKHKSEKKIKIFKQFHQKKFSTVLIKTIFYLRRGNARREHVNTQYLYTEWWITA